MKKLRWAIRYQKPYGEEDRCWQLLEVPEDDPVYDLMRSNWRCVATSKKLTELLPYVVPHIENGGDVIAMESFYKHCEPLLRKGVELYDLIYGGAPGAKKKFWEQRKGDFQIRGGNGYEV